MEQWLKIGLAVLIGVVALWVILGIISFIFSVVMTIIYYAVILTVLAVFIYGAYLLISKVGKGGSREKERERIFE